MGLLKISNRALDLGYMKIRTLLMHPSGLSMLLGTEQQNEYQASYDFTVVVWRVARYRAATVHVRLSYTNLVIHVHVNLGLG